jgi:hypothetical protein
MAASSIVRKSGMLGKEEISLAYVIHCRYGANVVTSQ